MHQLLNAFQNALKINIYFLRESVSCVMKILTFKMLKIVLNVNLHIAHNVIMVCMPWMNKLTKQVVLLNVDLVLIYYLNKFFNINLKVCIRLKIQSKFVNSAIQR